MSNESVWNARTEETTRGIKADLTNFSIPDSQFSSEEKAQLRRFRPDENWALRIGQIQFCASSASRGFFRPQGATQLKLAASSILPFPE
jgi:hypothetical protein